MVSLVAQLLAHPASRLGTENPGFLAVYLGRFQDKKHSIRLAVVEGAKAILLRHPELKDALMGELEKRSRDTEDTIRIAVVSTILTLAKKSLALVSDEVMEAVVARTADKKHRVRREALLCLATLYRKYAIGVGSSAAG